MDSLPSHIPRRLDSADPLANTNHKLCPHRVLQDITVDERSAHQTALEAERGNICPEDIRRKVGHFCAACGKREGKGMEDGRWGWKAVTLLDKGEGWL